MQAISFTHLSAFPSLSVHLLRLETTNGQFDPHLHHHIHSSQPPQSFLFLHALDKMLTATRLNVKPSFYPLGNTPATTLLRNHLSGVEPVEIFAIGCGDVRNILFTIWSEQRRACKLNFTACGYDPAVLGKHTSYLTGFDLQLARDTVLRRKDQSCLSPAQIYELS